MCTVLLIRHAEHPLTDDTLVGRDSATVHLSENGRKQAHALAESLACVGTACIQSSPRLRCLQTAAPLADRLGLPVHVHGALDEVDFGSWTGLRFDELENDPAWRAWNSDRASARPPRGETMAEARARILLHLERTSGRHSGAVAMFTHAEMVRAIKLHRAGLPVNAWRSVDVPLASVTALQNLLPMFSETLFEAAAS